MIDNPILNSPFAEPSRHWELDESGIPWASLYRTESRPFAKPKSGRIAAKVINHYGDEAMRVSRL